MGSQLRQEPSGDSSTVTDSIDTAEMSFCLRPLVRQTYQWTFLPLDRHLSTAVAMNLQSSSASSTKVDIDGNKILPSLVVMHTHICLQSCYWVFNDKLLPLYGITQSFSMKYHKEALLLPLYRGGTVKENATISLPNS